MKKRELAISIGVTERSVSGYENGSQEPESGTLHRIAEALGFPESFFFGDDPEIPTPDIASFRSLSKMSAALRDSALGAGAIALLLNNWIESRFDLPEPDIPDLGSDRNFSILNQGDCKSHEIEEYPAAGAIQEPEAAAEMLRAHWGLGQNSIRNLIVLLGKV